MPRTYHSINYFNKNGKLHREDGPAIIRSNGTKVWYANGKRHRGDGPAVVQSSGHKEWYYNGKLHREDGPAIIWQNRMKHWYINDKYCGKGDEPSEEYLEALKNYG